MPTINKLTRIFGLGNNKRRSTLQQKNRKFQSIQLKSISKLNQSLVRASA